MERTLVLRAGRLAGNAAIASEVLEAIAEGWHVVLDLDESEALRTTRTEIRRTLAVAALDRVFRIQETAA